MVPLWKDAKTGVRVVRLTRPEEIETLVHLFEEVANSEGWQPEGALRLHQKRSVYLAMLVQGELAGGLQLVLTSAGNTLPYQTLWQEVTIGTSRRCAHVLVLALAERFRGRSFLFWPLVIEMWRFCVGAGIAILFLEVTPRVLPLYRRLGWPLVIQGALRRHWGEECFLCTLGINEVAQALLQRAERSDSYRRILAQAFRMRLSAQASNPPTVGAQATLSGSPPAG